MAGIVGVHHLTASLGGDSGHALARTDIHSFAQGPRGRNDQAAQQNIRLPHAIHHLLLAHRRLPVVVRKDQDGPPPLFVAVLREVLGSVVDGGEDKGPSAKSEVDHPADGFFHFLQVVVERRHQPTLRVEIRQRHTVPLAQFGKRRVSGSGQSPDARKHAVADVEQQHEIESLLFLRAVEDVPLHPIVLDDKVVLLETIDGNGSIRDLGVHPDEGDIRPKDRVLRANQEGCNTPRGEHEQKDNPSPEPEKRQRVWPTHVLP